VKRIVEEAFARTVGLLQQRRESLDRVARTLLEKETLEESELTELAGQTSPREGTQVRTVGC
jgi:cell division protease FtsH